MNLRYCNFLFRLEFIIIFSLLSSNIKAQQPPKKANDVFYYFLFGGGVGGGYPQQEGSGIGAVLEVAYEKNNGLFALTYRELAELKLFTHANVNNGMKSIDMSYGRTFRQGKFAASLNGGVSFVYSEEKGAFISGTNGFFGLGSDRNYEKISRHAIGFPISVKFYGAPFKVFGAGLELYVNVNGISNFYGVNFNFLFGKLREPG